MSEKFVTGLCYVPEFTVWGKEGRGKADCGPEWILPLWDQANGNFKEISDAAEYNEQGVPRGIWGLMGHPDEYLGRWKEEGLYLAGAQVDKNKLSVDKQPPEGWTQWIVPGATYITAECSQAGYGEVFHWVIEEYLPSKELSMIGAAYEYYPEPANSDRVVLYFPIYKGYLHCQSCGMPLTEPGQLGKNADGGTNYEYCAYCFADGKFNSDCSMEEMIETCIPFEIEAGIYPDAETARISLNKYFPLMKRWRTR